MGFIEREHQVEPNNSYPLFGENFGMDRVGIDRLLVNKITVDNVGIMDVILSDTPGSSGFDDDKNKVHVVNPEVNNLAINSNALSEIGYKTLELLLKPAIGFDGDIEAVINFDKTGQEYETTMMKLGRREGTVYTQNWWFQMGEESDGSPRDIMLNENEQYTRGTIDLLIVRGGDN